MINAYKTRLTLLIVTASLLSLSGCFKASKDQAADEHSICSPKNEEQSMLQNDCLLLYSVSNLEWVIEEPDKPSDEPITPPGKRAFKVDDWFKVNAELKDPLTQNQRLEGVTIVHKPRSFFSFYRKRFLEKPAKEPARVDGGVVTLMTNFEVLFDDHQMHPTVISFEKVESKYKFVFKVGSEQVIPGETFTHRDSGGGTGR